MRTTWSLRVSNQLNEYRCTRNSPYMHKCMGHDNLSARQGHYVNCYTEEQALEIMGMDFPGDRHGFTVVFTKMVSKPTAAQLVNPRYCGE